ncbi:uncharacterized protein Z520_10962 [Fonsecaea multimorphosa CBS 102226]|uniref:Uncharacterized protein n=1 Tax=Fonsecaea multimorphosa CBS 102226 TaxID=1442371 RepID=A0A0D2JSB7_9EURO|nr:uncharacterized protein Z520_10962 [Fonsecaea multimorphosa CBS 102226]KIX93319.1 hypothetical protein Z520_10962 [Fonsecaea multimorphosa CBS 102226]OAL18557.1 hypothetical protein AYO22_10534 [Fonsecaea multimorphosa]
MASNNASERLFKYPPMERQDLNQSQLGSFKFTPVDPVSSSSSIQTLTQSAKLYLEEQLSRRLPRVAAGTSQNKLHTVTNVSPEKPLSYSNSSSADANFFNKHIKPDLGDSRLRLGPAALRSAVAGAASPTKNVSVIQVQQEPNAVLREQRQSTSFNAPELGLSQIQVPPLDPMSTAFPQEGEYSGQSLNDETSFSETLCVALANEQRAHSVTKAVLNYQIRKRTEAEDQLKQYRQQISSMTMTIKNLGDIIKYNTNKYHRVAPGVWPLERPGVWPDKLKIANFPDESEEEAALKEFYREYQKAKDAAKEKEQRKEKEQQTEKERSGTGVSAKKDTADVNVAPFNDVVDDAQLYNLELLKKPTFDDSADSILRRTLRKHFSIDENVDDGKAPTTPARRRPSINRLIDISPESLGEAKEKEKTEGEGDMAAPKEESRVDDLANEIQQRLKVSTNSKSQVRLLTTENPVLELPAEFVAKYGQKPVDAEAQASGEKSNGVKLHLSKAEVFLHNETPSKPSSDEQYGRLSPPSSLADDRHGQPATDVVPSTAAQPKSRITLQVGDNLHGEPKWLITKDNPIFDSEEEKWHALGENGIAWRQNSPFMDHPVRYLPEDAAGTTDAYRTVMIDAIPIGSTFPDVLSIVKGGSLESIQLFPPIGKVTNFMTARVVFNYEESAHNMIKHQEAKAGEDNDSNRFKIKGVAVRCWMPTDPTYPRNEELERKVLGSSGASRIILISDIDEYIYNTIPFKVKHPHAQHVIEYSYTPDGCASIEFTNVKTAIKVMGLLKMDEDFWNGSLQYDTDYTCTPYVKGEEMGN